MWCFYLSSTFISFSYLLRDFCFIRSRFLSVSTDSTSFSIDSIDIVFCYRLAFASISNALTKAFLSFVFYVFLFCMSVSYHLKSGFAIVFAIFFEYCDFAHNLSVIMYIVFWIFWYFIKNIITFSDKIKHLICH